MKIEGGTPTPGPTPEQHEQDPKEQLHKAIENFRNASQTERNAEFRKIKELLENPHSLSTEALNDLWKLIAGDGTYIAEVTKIFTEQLRSHITRDENGKEYIGVPKDISSTGRITPYGESNKPFPCGIDFENGYIYYTTSITTMPKPGLDSQTVEQEGGRPIAVLLAQL